MNENWSPNGLRRVWQPPIALDDKDAYGEDWNGHYEWVDVFAQVKHNREASWAILVSILHRTNSNGTLCRY
jgi:hypothetical protein